MMSSCQNCGRNMNNFNLVFCSIGCRKGIIAKNSGVHLNAHNFKMPPIEANIGLKRPYGTKTDCIKCVKCGETFSENVRARRTYVIQSLRLF